MQRLMRNPIQTCVALLLVLSLVPGLVLAQDNVVFKVGSTEVAVVPIDTANSVVLDGNGDLQVTCTQDPQKTSPACTGIGDGASGDAASVASFVFQTGGTISGGGTATNIGPTDSLAITVAWTVANAPTACIGTSNPAVTGWNSSNVSATGSTFSTTLSNTGTTSKNYSLSIECFNAAGSAGTKTITATVQPRTVIDPPPTEQCNIVKANIVDPVERGMFQPTGYIREDRSWTFAFNNNAYPGSWGAHYPIGSWTLGNQAGGGVVPPAMRGKYLTIPFTADTAQQHKLEWIAAVSIAQLSNYRPRPATGLVVTMSPCPGDFRTSEAFAGPVGDETMRIACRLTRDTGSMFFGQRVNTSVCPIVAGQTYYLNIMFADPADGSYSTTESTCDTNHPNAASGVCDAEFFMRN